MRSLGDDSVMRESAGVTGVAGGSLLTNNDQGTGRSSHSQASLHPNNIQFLQVTTMHTLQYSSSFLPSNASHPSYASYASVPDYRPPSLPIYPVIQSPVTQCQCALRLSALASFAIWDGGIWMFHHGPVIITGALRNRVWAHTKKTFCAQRAQKTFCSLRPVTCTM